MLIEGGTSFDAVIFDMDGVITKTAQLHQNAWKEMFDTFLSAHARTTGVSQREFSPEDYLQYIDGKPRYEGVKSLLDSRGISLPHGDLSDPPGDETICGLGNWKNQLFNQMVNDGLVDVFESTLTFIHELRRLNIHIGVASSSKNTRSVLASAGITDLFEARVDGETSIELGLKGKPEADIFLKAASLLGCSPYRCVVVEDAIVGVAAAARGGFGLVLGVARSDNRAELLAQGADIVVGDLSEIKILDIEHWFKQGLPQDEWALTIRGYDPDLEGIRETLFTVGNGYAGTRGALDEVRRDAHHYPGTYVAGVYNALQSEVNGHAITNEDMVNLPNWLTVQWKIDDGDWFDIAACMVLEMERTLDFRTGELRRTTIVQDHNGHITRIEARRLASMDDPHLFAAKYSLTPQNYAGRISIRTGLDGDVINWGVERYRQLACAHLEPIFQKGDQNRIYLEMATTQSQIHVAFAAEVAVFVDDAHEDVEWTELTRPGEVCLEGVFDAAISKTISLEKTVSLYTSREAKDPLAQARRCVSRAERYHQTAGRSHAAWMELWDRIDIQIEGDRLAQKLIRLSLYHLMMTTSPHSVGLDAGIPARGLTGESYRGHIFWDELFILMFHQLHFPAVVREVLLYRYRRLEAAKTNAKQHGCAGALYPWQSGSDGSEQSQILHLNPLSGEWGPDYSSLQRHVSLAIAYNIWQYVWINEDEDFLMLAGAEMFFEICRLWASLAVRDEATGRFDIPGVMGPDEYHEAYPGAETGGVGNNSYTNIMVMWLFKKADELISRLPEKFLAELQARMDLSLNEVAHWNDLRTKLNVSIRDGSVLEQFDGYMDLEELDWGQLREKYGKVHRMDRILKAEGKTPDSFQVTKQADVLMAFYNLSAANVISLLNDAGYAVGGDILARTFDYYLPRTSHGSTLSPIVHAHLAYLLGRDELSARLFHEALLSDYLDVQGKTTAEGIHLGVMAGCVVMCIRAYAGIDLEGPLIKLDPRLPAGWTRLGLNLQHRGVQSSIIITPAKVRVRFDSNEKQSGELIITGHRTRVAYGQWLESKLQSGAN